MPTFDELVKFVKWHSEGYRKAKSRRHLEKGMEEAEKKLQRMMEIFNKGISQLDETDQHALRLSLAGAMRDTLTTYLSFMSSERRIRLPDDWL